MLQIRKIVLALMVLMSLGTASVEASYSYVDYWETYVTNLRTQATVIVIEPLGLQHQTNTKGVNR